MAGAGRGVCGSRAVLMTPLSPWLSSSVGHACGGAMCRWFWSGGIGSNFVRGTRRAPNSAVDKILSHFESVGKGRCLGHVSRQTSHFVSF